MSRDWDAAGYDRVSAPQVEWALRVLERLPLRGDETVLDAGCGSGRVTQLLLERLPRGRVVAVDSAPSMVEHAREALDPERATVLQADLTDLELDAPVDAVLRHCAKRGLDAGYPLSPAYPEFENGLLVAITERRSCLDIHRLAEALDEAVRSARVARREAVKA